MTSLNYSKGESLKKHAIVSGLPYHRKIIAHSLIDRGADLPLVYLWFNLIHGHYTHIPIKVVMETVTDYIHKYPAFETDITEWFKTFEKVARDEKSNRID